MDEKRRGEIDGWMDRIGGDGWSSRRRRKLTSGSGMGHDDEAEDDGVKEEEAWKL